MLVMVSCIGHQIPEGTWIDSTDERTMVHIKQNQGKFWMEVEDRAGLRDPLEIAVEGHELFVILNHRKASLKMPLAIRDGGESLRFREMEYIPFSQSWKGRFAGHWKAISGKMEFQVRLDENIDLIWDIVTEENKPIRFWPKRTEDGFYFTRDNDVWSFSITDGIMVDRDGNRYKKVSDM